MSVPLYDATVATYLQTVGAVAHVLSRGLEHCRVHAIDPAELTDTRIAPDMLPFRFQVGSVIAHSVHAIEGVRAGMFRPMKSMLEGDYAALQQAVAAALETLARVEAAEVESWLGRDMRFEVEGRTLPFTAENFLLSFSLPNFFFHTSMTYAILRAKGVPLGKRDFLGRPRLKL